MMAASKRPYNAQNLAQENRKKRMLRRAGFFNPVSMSGNAPLSTTSAGAARRKYHSIDLSISQERADEATNILE